MPFRSLNTGVLLLASRKGRGFEYTPYAAFPEEAEASEHVGEDWGDRVS